MVLIFIHYQIHHQIHQTHLILTLDINLIYYFFYFSLHIYILLRIYVDNILYLNWKNIDYDNIIDKHTQYLLSFGILLCWIFVYTLPYDFVSDNAILLISSSLILIGFLFLWKALLIIPFSPKWTVSCSFFYRMRTKTVKFFYFNFLIIFLKFF